MDKRVEAMARSGDPKAWVAKDLASSAQSHNERMEARRKQSLDDAQRYLAALEQAGYAVVPVEFSDEYSTFERMIEAMREARLNFKRSSGACGQTLEECWKFDHRLELVMFSAMLQATKENGDG